MTPITDQLASAPIDTERYVMIAFHHLRVGLHGAHEPWERKKIMEAIQILQSLEDDYRNASPLPAA